MYCQERVAALHRQHCCRWGFHRGDQIVLPCMRVRIECTGHGLQITTTTWSCHVSYVGLTPMAGENFGMRRPLPWELPCHLSPMPPVCTKPNRSDNFQFDLFLALGFREAHKTDFRPVKPQMATLSSKSPISHCPVLQGSPLYRPLDSNFPVDRVLTSKSKVC